MAGAPPLPWPACEPARLPSVWFRFQGGPPEARAYDGPALIEYFGPDPLDPAAGQIKLALGGGTAEASTATISGTPPMLPVGTTVWLTKTVGPSDQAGFGEQPFYFAVRERAGGRILFGGLVRHSGQDLGPFATGAMTPFCSYFSVCHVFTHYSIEVRADTIVNVRSGDTADIKLDGTEYALSVTVVTAGEHIAGCVISDFYAAPPIRLAFEAKDLQGSAHP